MCDQHLNDEHGCPPLPSLDVVDLPSLPSIPDFVREGCLIKLVLGGSAVRHDIGASPSAWRPIRRTRGIRVKVAAMVGARGAEEFRAVVWTATAKAIATHVDAGRGHLLTEDSLRFAV